VKGILSSRQAVVPGIGEAVQWPLKAVGGSGSDAVAGQCQSARDSGRLESTMAARAWVIEVSSSTSLAPSTSPECAVETKVFLGVTC